MTSKPKARKVRNAAYLSSVRRALYIAIAVAPEKPPILCREDVILAILWQQGFKIVPVDED